MSADMQQLEAMKNELQRAIEDLIELGIIVHDYPDEPSTKTALDMDIQKYVQDIVAVRKSAKAMKETKVPIDILDYIDAGRNPDIYSREFVELVAKQNQFVKGKMATMGSFQEKLAGELEKVFPDIAGDLADVRLKTSIA